MRSIVSISAALIIVISIGACGGSDAPKAGPPGTTAKADESAAAKSDAKMITAADLQLGDIDAGMVAKGTATYDVKCAACHSKGAKRIVGPGWEGVTERRKPEWIMNMILNVDMMLESDPEAQKSLEECLVRMPNQGLSKDEAREVLEFMRTLKAS